MKKHVSILSVFLLALPVFMMAQEEVFPTGTTWKEVLEEIYVPKYPECYTPMDTLQGTHTYEIGLDTIIGGRTYKQVLMDGRPWDCVIREEGGCVWMLADGYAQEFKLYDFNWTGCDTIVTQYLREQDKYATWVAPEDEITDLSKLTTEQGVQRVDCKGRIVIRGMGCVSELYRWTCLLGHRKMNPTIPGLEFVRVLWLRKNGKEVYRYYGKNEWTVGIEEVRKPMSPTILSEVVYDLQGRRLANKPQKGVYIQDGRKYVR